MILDDIVEYVEVGENKVKCLRLTKYNPDFVPRVKPTVPDNVSAVVHTLEDLCMSCPRPRHDGRLTVQYGNTRVRIWSLAVSPHSLRSRTRLRLSFTNPGMRDSSST